MMKKGIIYKTLLLAATLSLAGCSQDEVIGSGSGAMVPVTVQLPGIYGTMSGKAATRASHNGALNSIPILNLEEGSTLWLLAERRNSPPTIQGYIVKSSGGGVQSLYPSGTQTHSDGTTDIDKENVSTTPLFLTPGTYTFRAISPAKTIYPNNKFKVSNGEYVVATNDAWTQTEATAITIDGKEGIIVLNPLMQVGARMTFTIKKTDNISSISVIQSGVEIDGLGEEPATADYTVGTDLITRIGDSYNRLFVPFFYFRETEDGLKSDIGIRPVDCRSTAVYVIMNLMINGTPVQYTFTVKDRLFKPGYSYDYVVTIDIKNGITIANWQENSWSTDVTPQ